MGFYREQILPRGVHFLMDTEEIRGVRRRALAGATGRVLEIGFGSGLSLPCYPEGVTELLALDPAVVGRKLAADAVAAAPFPVRHLRPDGARVPLPDASVDAVATQFTLCTLPDLDGALAEIHRVLRPGGSFHFAEHGLGPDAPLARRQRGWNRLQMLVGGGCRLDRRIPWHVHDAGFSLSRLTTEWLSGPRTHTYVYVGVGRKR